MLLSRKHLTSIFRGVTVEYIGIAEIMLAHMTELTNLQIKKQTMSAEDVMYVGNHGSHYKVQQQVS